MSGQTAGLAIDPQASWLDPVCSLATYPPSASWPDGRSGKGRKAVGEESPGSMETRCRVMPGGGDPRESATESKPPRPQLR